MDLTTLPIFKMVVGRMGWLSKRQEILAQNISNSDTPDYRPLDLKEQSFASLLRPTVKTTALRHTSAAHMDPVQPPPGEAKPEKSRETYEVAPAGNAVIIEEQLMKVADTQSQYRLATNLYAKHISMLKQAIGRDRG